MKTSKTMVMAALLSAPFVTKAMADCQLADAKLEEAILQKNELQGASNREIVRDLRTLRDAAFILRTYGLHDDCERVLANIRSLVSGPSIGSLGDSDEGEADKQIAAQEPKAERGAILGDRDEKNAKPLVEIDSLVPGLRADEFIGGEVRSADDAIVGEVRNIVFGTRDRPDYAIVASGGFFKPGDNSIVVPIRSMRVSQERDSFFLALTSAEVKAVPLMPDQAFGWVSDAEWRARNDAVFSRP